MTHTRATDANVEAMFQRGATRDHTRAHTQRTQPETDRKGEDLAGAREPMNAKGGAGPIGPGEQKVDDMVAEGPTQTNQGLEVA